MASIIDSFKETISDSTAFYKIVVLSIPVYFSLDAFAKSEQDYSWCIFLSAITLFFLFGVLIKVTSGVLNEQDTVFPPLKPLKIILSALKGFVAVTPISIFSIWLANYAVSFINIIPWLDITLKSVIWILVASVIMTVFLMFVSRESIKDAYNLKMLSDKSADLMVALIFYIIQIVLVNVVVVGFVGYSIVILFGFGPLFNFLISAALVFNIGLSGHYFAQLQYEVLGYDKDAI